MKKIHSLCLLLFFLTLTVCQLEQNTKGFIETRRLFIFDSLNGFQANQQGLNYEFTFNRNFTTIPRIGLAVYTIDFEYSSVFSCQVTSDITVSSATLYITTSTVTGQDNQLYIMYIATDHDFMGIFMPGQLITFLLTNPGPGLTTQSSNFNFKQQIAGTSLKDNIRVSVYLTGISSSSQLIRNGYPINRGSFGMNASVLTSTDYQIDVWVNSQFGDITLTLVEYTVIYFDVSVMQKYRYNMGQGVATLTNFGGTADTSSKSITLQPLPDLEQFQDLKIFYGISRVDCRQGNSITLSAIHKLYLNPTTNLTQVFLTMQTWKLTYVIQARYNFVQYQSRRCDLNGSNCGDDCFQSTKPKYIQNDVCHFCQITCLTCNISRSKTRCDLCPQNRTINNAGLCICNSGFYDTFDSNQCESCFPCATCSLKGVCLTCDASAHLVLNTILSKCQCAPSFYPNMLANNISLNNTTPCLPCPKNCLYCQNNTFCIACDYYTYLNKSGACVILCNPSQTFQQNNFDCITAQQAQFFEQQGRLGYSWTYQANQSLIDIMLTFSQANCNFFYHQNGMGYNAFNSQANSAGLQRNYIYFDDGINAQGYAQAQAGAQQSSITSMNSNAASIFSNMRFDQYQAMQGSNIDSISNLFARNGGIDASMINGSYYGLGQMGFFRYLYLNHVWKENIDPYYTDQYGVMYGKYNISSSTAPRNPNYVDALARNLAVQVGGVNLPYSITPVSNSQFRILATTPQSFNGEEGYLILKDPGLVRSGNTAAQFRNVSQSMYVYSCGIPSYVNSANSICDSTRVITGVLWGVSKYPLFIGFGWFFMPLMLSLQFIMSFNYLKTNMPLNLDRFLACFADFRNPSILYNPMRNDMDRSIFTHPNLYQSIPVFNEFDRGLDFMYNCFQFFFVPFLSMVLYGIIVGVNKIINCTCNRDIPFISRYIQPRWPLQIGAYTLVQALPVSFFFFAQLNDMRLSSPLVNASYPVFNIAMAFLSLFLTCAIPLMLATFIYFQFHSRQSRVNNALGFKQLFVNLLEARPNSLNRANLDDPLWTGSPMQTISYGFCAAVFYLAIFWGFFVSFFYNSLAWQITGLVVITAAFMAFAAVSSQFDSWLIKAFWIVFGILLIIGLLVAAGIGSTISPTPCQLQNIGYFGIGLLYALVLAGIIASIYLISMAAINIYDNFFDQKRFIVPLDHIQQQQLRQKAKRTKAFESVNTKMKSTYMKNPIASSLPMIGSRMNMGSFNSNANMGVNMPSFNSNTRLANNMRIQEEPPVSGDRMIVAIPEVGEEEDTAVMREKLVFVQVDPRGDYVFRTDRTNRTIRIDGDRGRRLRNNQPIMVDHRGDVYDRNDLFQCNLNDLVGGQNNVQRDQINVPSQGSNVNIINTIINNVPGQNQIMKINTIAPQAATDIIKNQSTRNYQNQPGSTRRLRKQYQQPQTIVQNIVQNIIEIGNDEYQKIDEDQRGNIILRNINTGQEKIMPLRDLKLTAVQTRQIQQQQYSDQEKRQLSPNKREIQSRRDMNLKRQIDNAVASIKSNAGRNIRQTLPPSPEIVNNRVILQKNRKIPYNNGQYMDMGHQNSKHKLYNLQNRSTQYFSPQEYLRMNLQSFNKKININGTDYDVVGQDSDGVNLVDKSRRTPKRISLDEYNMVRQQNQAALMEMVNNIPGYRGVDPRVVQRMIVESGSGYVGGPMGDIMKTMMMTKYSNQGQPGGLQNTVQTIQTSTTRIQRGPGMDVRPMTVKTTHSVQTNKEGLQASIKSPNNLLLQSKARGQQIYQPKKYTTQVQVVQTVRRTASQDFQDQDQQQVKEIIEQSPGPFLILAVPRNKVVEIDDEDNYNKEDAIERLTVDGNNVISTRKFYQKKHPSAVIFMVDMSNEEEYRLN